MSQYERRTADDADVVVHSDKDSSIGYRETENDAKISRDMDGSSYPSGNDNSSDTSSEASSSYNTTSEEFWKEGQRQQSKMYASMMAAQKAFLNSASYDMQVAASAAAASYYRWLPGMNPMQIPAFFYQPKFLHYNEELISRNKASKAAAAAVGKAENHLHCDRKHASEWEETTNEESKSEKVQCVIKTKDIMSDIDEGLVLEENDSEMTDAGRVPRRSQETVANGREYPPRATQVASTTVSVIQENSFLKHGSAAGQDDVNKQTSKRGRASTRHIEKTEQYWDRRKKNNMSAKKSRDARRQREMMTNQRSAMLEAENLRLRAELATVREENDRLRRLLKSN